MVVLSNRVLLQPTDFERPLRFYSEILGLHVYRERGSRAGRGMVFIGGGFLELSVALPTPTSENAGLWLQVRDVDFVGRELEGAGPETVEAPTNKPWGLREITVRDPAGLGIVIVEVPENHPLRRR
jgi:catechol 2,3-dioxygenase-like lactoylglutathione lyase family enzyme